VEIVETVLDRRAVYSSDVQHRRPGSECTRYCLVPRAYHVPFPAAPSSEAVSFGVRPHHGWSSNANVALDGNGLDTAPLWS